MTSFRFRTRNSSNINHVDQGSAPKSAARLAAEAAFSASPAPSESSAGDQTTLPRRALITFVQSKVSAAHAELDADDGGRGGGSNELTGLTGNATDVSRGHISLGGGTTRRILGTREIVGTHGRSPDASGNPGAQPGAHEAHTRAPRIFLLPKAEDHAASQELDTTPVTPLKPAPGTGDPELVARFEASLRPGDATLPAISAAQVGLRKSLRVARKPVDIIPSVLPASLAELDAARVANAAAGAHDFGGLLNDLASLDGVFDDTRSAEDFDLADLTDVGSAEEWDRLGTVANEIGSEIAVAMRALRP
jgi:hypothetical protein